jgi:hypothetical protein
MDGKSESKANHGEELSEGMQEFTNWNNVIHTELLDEAEEEIKSGKLMREQNIMRYLTGFRKY